MKKLFLILGLVFFTTQGLTAETKLNQAFGIQFGKKIPKSLMVKKCDNLESSDVWWIGFEAKQCFDFIPPKLIDGFDFERYNLIIHPITQEAMIISAFMPFAYDIGPDSQEFSKCRTKADELINILFKQYNTDYITENTIPEDGGDYFHRMTFGETIWESSNIQVQCNYPYAYRGLLLSYIYIQ